MTDDEAAYAKAVSAHAFAFAHRHTEHYRRMLVGAFAGYTRGEVGGFRRRMERVDREAAHANGLPRFAEWCAARTPVAA